MIIEPIGSERIPVILPPDEARITRAVEDTRAIEAGEASEALSLDSSETHEIQQETVFADQLYSILRERNQDDITRNDQIEQSSEALLAFYIAMQQRPVRVETVHGFAVDVVA